MERYDILIVGGGAAGLSAARAAVKRGASVLLADNRERPGGVMLQCLHRGFGRERTGPEYIREYLEAGLAGVRCCWKTTVLGIDRGRTAVLSSEQFGIVRIGFRQLILATGCREIPAGALDIAGTRPRGVMTAGESQEALNLYGQAPKAPVVILGSGDLGLIMARSLWDAGIQVAAVVERAPVCGGLPVNRRRLEGCSIPILLNSTVMEVFGEGQLEAVTVCDLISGEEKRIFCRTLLIAVGLVPEREVIREMEDVPWLTLCGNCRQVQSRVEAVIQDGTRAGCTACDKLREQS